MNVLQGTVLKIRHNGVTRLFKECHFSPSESGSGLLSRCTWKKITAQLQCFGPRSRELGASHMPASTTGLESFQASCQCRQQHAALAGGGTHQAAKPRESLNPFSSQGRGTEQRSLCGKCCSF